MPKIGKKRGRKKRGNHWPAVLGAVAAGAAAVYGTFLTSTGVQPDDPSRAQAQIFLAEYWRDAVELDDCCWERLSPTFQRGREAVHGQGEAEYRAWFDSLERVDVTHLEHVQDGDFSARLTIRYRSGAIGTVDSVFTLACPAHTAYWPWPACGPDNMLIDSSRDVTDAD